MQPLVSIIIPVYNVEKYLHKCVDSVLGQTYTNIEVYLIDDGSTDSSGGICDEYLKKDNRIKVIHKENGGQGSARNMALDVCKGEYIAFVDSDDYIKSDMIEIMVSEMLKTSSELAICGIAVDTGIRFVENSGYTEERVLETYSLMKDYVSTPNIHTGPCNKVYCKKLFDSIRFPNFRAHEDAFIMHKILGQCSRAVHVGKCLYVQFIRDGSTEQSAFSEKKLKLLDCADDLADYYKNNFPDLYYLVAYKKVNDIAVLMYYINAKFCFIKNKCDYKMLAKLLVSEYDKLSSFVPKESKLSQKAGLALKHPIYFRLNGIVNGVTFLIKRIIRRICSRIRSK